MRIGRTAAGVIATQGREECRTDDGAGRNPGQCVGVWAALGLLTTHTTKTHTVNIRTKSVCPLSQSTRVMFFACCLTVRGKLSAAPAHTVQKVRDSSNHPQQQDTSLKTKTERYSRESDKRASANQIHKSLARDHLTRAQARTYHQAETQARRGAGA